MSATNLPAIVHKNQRVLRTIVQVGIPAFIGLAGILPQVITSLGLPVTSQLYVALVGAAASVTGIAGLLSRLMANPTVDAWLAANGLGSVPRSELTLVHTPTQQEALRTPATIGDGASAGLSS